MTGKLDVCIENLRVGKDRLLNYITAKPGTYQSASLQLRITWYVFLESMTMTFNAHDGLRSIWT